VSRGKVRDIYDLGEHLLIVTTDRISAFDWVLPNGIPDKGRVLNQLSAFWFNVLGNIVPNHLVSIEIGGERRENSRSRTTLTLALAVCLVFAYVAHAIGLAPIVGAFAAGLVLEEVHFRDFEAPRIRAEVLGAVARADEQTRAAVDRVLDHHRERHLEHLGLDAAVAAAAGVAVVGDDDHRVLLEVDDLEAAPDRAVGDLGRQAPQGLPLGVDEVPVAVNLARFDGGGGHHAERRTVVRPSRLQSSSPLDKARPS